MCGLGLCDGDVRTGVQAGDVASVDGFDGDVVKLVPPR